MTYKLHTEAFKAGYSDMFYGKDNRENYKGQELIEYLSGMEDCIEDIQEEVENER